MHLLLPITLNAAGGMVSLAIALALTVPVQPLLADEFAEEIEIRGQRMTVWPADDLRERGFDIVDVPRAQNAAWIYLEAWNTYSDPPTDLTDALDYAVGKGWPTDQDRFRKWLTRKENREALKLARKAAGMERCQMPYFGDPNGGVISVLLPSLSPHRMVAKLLVADGRRLAAQKNYRGAMDNYAAALRMGHHVTHGITLIEGLVGVACWNIGDQAVRDMVLRYEIPKHDLKAITEQWNRLKALMPTVERGFECERVIGPSFVDEVVSRPTALLLNIHRIYNGDVGGGRAHDGWDRLEARIGHVFLPDRTIKRHMYSFYDRLAEIARTPYYDERVRNFDEERLHEAIPTWDVFSRTLLPSLSRSRILGERCRADTRATTLALALRGYAQEHRGKNPAELAELGGGVDSEDLIDPFGGGEFGYTRSSRGWKLHSVGPDGTDNGGESGKRWDEAGSDMVYVFPPDKVEPFEDTDED
ncbi:MAG: hypothetical protein GY842_26570 [bacterium]|nr:hypothetical protein [bacterium]